MSWLSWRTAACEEHCVLEKGTAAPADEHFNEHRGPRLNESCPPEAVLNLWLEGSSKMLSRTISVCTLIARFNSNWIVNILNNNGSNDRVAERTHRDVSPSALQSILVSFGSFKSLLLFILFITFSQNPKSDRHLRLVIDGYKVHAAQSFDSACVSWCRTV